MCNTYSPIVGNSDGIVFAINHDSMSYSKLPLIIGDVSVMKSHDVCIQSAIYRESIEMN